MLVVWVSILAELPLLSSQNDTYGFSSGGGVFGGGVGWLRGGLLWLDLE